jgi:hypothetical protein
MRPSIKRSLTGLLIVGALVSSATVASAMNNGRDAFLGIVGGNPGRSVGCIPYNEGIYQGGGYRANTDHGYQHGYAGNGAYDGPNH